MAKTGQPRKTKQPLKIDRLPEVIRESIQYLRNTRGKTWQEIEDLSAAPYDKDWAKKIGSGFIDWTALDPDVLDEFPGLKLPKSTLQRWYDIRIEQVRAEVLRESAAARAFAEKFVGRDLKDVNAAVINALRDEIFGAMRSVSDGNRAVFIGMLGDLTLAMSRIQRVDIMKRNADVEERKVAQLEKEFESRRRKMDAEAEKLTKKAAKGEVTPADIDRLRERVFGLPPKAAA